MEYLHFLFHRVCQRVWMESDISGNIASYGKEGRKTMADFSRDLGENRNGDPVKTNHTVHLENRRHLELSGIEDVIRFDETGAEFRTAEGNLLIDGKDFRMDTFDLSRGIVTLDGEIAILEYTGLAQDQKKEQKRGLFGRRLF